MRRARRSIGSGKDIRGVLPACSYGSSSQFVLPRSELTTSHSWTAHHLGGLSRGPQPTLYGFEGAYVLWQRLKEEWGLAAVNIFSMSLCNAAIVWSLAPCRSYGSTFKFNLQNTIQKLPSNIFERSYAFREFDMAKRVQSFFYKAGELCLVGLLTGAASGGLVKLIASGKENLSVPAPAIKTSALSYGAFIGLSGNLRYQLVYGAEKVMQQNFNHIGVVVFCSLILRALNIYVGDASRVSWLGLDVTAEQTAEIGQQAYRRPSLPSLNQLESMLKFDNLLPKAPSRRKVKRRVLVAS
ncbi:hypothetical protein L7F22_003962 [Adiantum nelumboides]|nr:hypothetical protein [Adiantum nelumboides]